MEPIAKAFRKGLQDTPSFNDLVKALDSARKNWRVHPVQELSKPTAVARSPFLTLGSQSALDVPPFLTIATSDAQGDNSATELPFADDFGFMQFLLNPGVVANGSITAWAAVGQLFVPQSDGLMMLSAAPTYNWSANWWSEWWRLAGGSVTLEFIVSVFDSTGQTFLGNTVLGSNSLFSENDESLSEGDQSEGGSSTDGLEMSGWTSVNSGNLCFCWVQLVGWASANQKANFGASKMTVFANASVSSLLIYMP